MLSPITATIDPEKPRAILYAPLHIPQLKSFRVFIGLHSDSVKPVHETLLGGFSMDCECDLVGVKRISGWQGKGTEAEGA